MQEIRKSRKLEKVGNWKSLEIKKTRKSKKKRKKSEKEEIRKKYEIGKSSN